MRRVAAAARRAYRYLRTFEPARLTALKTAVFAVAAAGGVTLSGIVSERIVAGFGVATVLLALIQGEYTRKRVSPADVGDESG